MIEIIRVKHYSKCSGEIGFVTCKIKMYLIKLFLLYKHKTAKFT